MAQGITIRRYSGSGDLTGIEQLVTNVVLECYGHLLSAYRFDPDENWPASWIAEHDGVVIGVMMSNNDWVDDLWIAAPHRRVRIGSELLVIAEKEIAVRGFEVGRLRVVGENVQAVRFYLRHGWVEDSRYPHEINGFEMVEMTKSLSPNVIV